MIKVFFHKVFSIGLALLVLCSTTSFTVEKHYCGDVLIDASVFLNAENCSPEGCNSEEKKVAKKRCCKDIVEIVEGQDQLKINHLEEITFEQQVIIYSYLYSYINTLETLPKLIIPHKNYSPPDLIIDLQILEEVFLI